MFLIKILEIYLKSFIVIPRRLNHSHEQKSDSSLIIIHNNRNPSSISSTTQTSSLSPITTSISQTKSSKRLSTSSAHSTILNRVKSSISPRMIYSSTTTQHDLFPRQNRPSTFFDEFQTTSKHIEETTESSTSILTSIKPEPSHSEQEQLTTESSVTIEPSFPKTPPSMFQFLPFRPSADFNRLTTSFPIININSHEKPFSAQRHYRLREKHIKYF